MEAIAQEIQGFSRERLRKQRTVVTSVDGRRHVELRLDEGLLEEEEGKEEEEVKEEEGHTCWGFVEDTCLDLHVGLVRPFLLLASQDVAHDLDTLKRHKVSHVLNVASGVLNVFPEQMVYKTQPMLDLPEFDVISCLDSCSSFIDQAVQQGGVVLVHCNAGVSRCASIVIGYLMLREGLSFDEAYQQVKEARPSIQPNPGFSQQLKNYRP